LLVLAVLATSRKGVVASTSNSSNATKKEGGTVGSQSNPKISGDEVAGFRLLVTILAGVALGAAASSLPSQMARSTTGLLFIATWLLWTAGIFAVILTYLSTLTGAKIIPVEIDLAHTISLTLKTVCECGLFASLTLSDPHKLIRWWFISFAAFGATAAIAILLALLLLPKSPRTMSKDARDYYRRSQLSDAAMATLTAIISAIYLVRTPTPTDRSVLIAAAVALAAMISACTKQYFERQRMTRVGFDLIAYKVPVTPNAVPDKS
jgi:hypothetical protein